MSKSLKDSFWNNFCLGSRDESDDESDDAYTHSISDSFFQFVQSSVSTLSDGISDGDSVCMGLSVAAPFCVGTVPLLFLAVPTLAVLLTVCSALPILAIVFTCVGFTVAGAGALYWSFEEDNFFREYYDQHGLTYLFTGNYGGGMSQSQKCFAAAMVGDALLAFGAILLFTTVGGALLASPVTGAVLMGLGAFLLLCSAIAYIDSKTGDYIAEFSEKLEQGITMFASKIRWPLSSAPLTQREQDKEEWMVLYE